MPCHVHPLRAFVPFRKGDAHARADRQAGGAVLCCAFSFVRSPFVRRSPFVLRSTRRGADRLHDPIGGGRGVARAAHFMMMIIDA